MGYGEILVSGEYQDQQSSTSTLNDDFNNPFSGGFCDNSGRNFGLDVTDFSQNAGGFGRIPFPIQTSWPSNQNLIGPSTNVLGIRTPYEQ